MATNFQDVVAKVKNLGALAPVLGAISRPVINGLFVGYRAGRVVIIKVMALVARSRLNCVRGLKHIKLNQFEIFSFLSLQLVIII